MKGSGNDLLHGCGKLRQIGRRDGSDDGKEKGEKRNSGDNDKKGRLSGVDGYTVFIEGVGNAPEGGDKGFQPDNA